MEHYHDNSGTDSQPPASLGSPSFQQSTAPLELSYRPPAQTQANQQHQQLLQDPQQHQQHQQHQQLHPLQQQHQQLQLQIQQHQQQLQLQQKLRHYGSPTQQYLPQQISQTQYPSPLLQQHHQQLYQQFYPPSGFVYTPPLQGYYPMNNNKNNIKSNQSPVITDMDAPAPFFVESTIDDDSLGVVTPQIDTTNMMISPSLLDPSTDGNTNINLSSRSVPRPTSQITPVNEVASSLVQPQKRSHVDNSGILTLLRPPKPKTKTKSLPKARPAFVVKVWTMVNDPVNQPLINWSQDGESFIITHREEFVQQVLPKYFKHSNFASFVRQLNMYGWHKVQDANSGALHSDERWQFSNPSFQRDHPEFLDQIVRNKPQDDREEEHANGTKVNQFDISMLILELNTLKSNQLKITQELSRVRQDNDLLWQELYSTRERNLVQNEKVERILQFLSSIYGNNKVPMLENQLDDDDDDIDAEAEGHVASDFTSTPTEHYEPPRLMIKQQRHASNPSSTTSNTPGNGQNFNEVDNSPVQEILRTPANSIQQNSQTQEYLDNQLNQAKEDELYQQQTIPLIQRALVSAKADNPPVSMPPPALATHNDVNTDQSRAPFRPSLRPTPSLDELTKTIEQQGHSLNEIISRLQDNQYDQPPAFDLEEFLNEELPETSNTSNTSTVTNTTPRVSLQEIQDDDLKRGIEEEHVEEIINPSKKRKSGNY